MYKFTYMYYEQYQEPLNGLLDIFLTMVYLLWLL